MALSNALSHHALEIKSMTDPLTGLTNRHGLDVAMESHAGRRPYTVLVMDLDGLKSVNDKRGHETGDELLVQVARSMSGVLRSGHTLARVGGDEFVAFLPDCHAIDARMVAHRILEAIEHIDVHGVKAHLSIGGACGGPETPTPRELKRLADSAMYVAKENGGDQFALHESAEAAVPA
jgi:diguanylate cyclase (GGDEF)-like protein